MLSNLTDLLVHEIKDLYSAETQLLEALPKMEANATNSDLKLAFRHHLKETQNQVERLVQAGRILGVNITSENCHAMEGLIREGEETIKERASAAVKDAALISVAQRVEHYEIAAYGSAVCFAHCTDQRDVKELLETTLDEEKSADSKLTKLAMGGMLSSGINQQAATR